MTRALTLAAVRAALAPLGIAVRRTQAGDLRVNFTGAEEATAYYTDDYADALATGQAMADAVSRVKQGRELARAREAAELARRAALARMERLLEDASQVERAVQTVSGGNRVWFGKVRNVVDGTEVYRTHSPIGQARFVAPAVHAFQVRHQTAIVADLLRYDLNNPNATKWWQPVRSR